MKTKTAATKEDADILIITRHKPESVLPRLGASGDRSVSEIARKAGKAALQYVSLSPDVLQAQLATFLEKMNAVVKKLPEKIGEYDLDTIELSVEITAKGSVGLLGSGGEVGGSGGLTFTLKRKSSS